MYIHIHTYKQRTRQRRQALHPPNQARAQRQLPQRVPQRLQARDFGHLCDMVVCVSRYPQDSKLHQRTKPTTDDSITTQSQPPTHLQPLRPHHAQRLHPRLQRHAVRGRHDAGGGRRRRVQPPFPFLPMRVAVVVVVAAAAPTTLATAGGSGLRCRSGGGGGCWCWGVVRAWV